MRSGSKNICSVRQRPIPSAPKAIACFASAGLSALVRTFNVLTSSAHDISSLYAWFDSGSADFNETLPR